jgi:hypothetical protein
MAGVFQGDVILKAMVDLGLEEMRKNLWLLDHAFESLTAMPFLADKYGKANIEAAKEWFKNNKVNVYMRPRNDKDELPCVTIFPGSSNEKPEMKSLSDLSSYKKILKPNEIGKPINYIVKPFTPEGYNPATGEVFVANGLTGLSTVVPGQILVNPKTGQGFVIQSTTSDSIVILPNQNIESAQFAVVPEFQKYEARIEHTFHQESYTVGVHCHGDPQSLMWLWTIVLYTIYRYREVLLEGNGFAESVISNSEFMDDPNYEGPNGESAYLRYITITGQVEESWIKAPKRFIESISLKDIEIISNLNDASLIDQTNSIWYTIKDDGLDSDGDND